MAKKTRFLVAKFFTFLFFILVAAAAGIFLQIIYQLPDIATINSYKPRESTLIFSADGKTLARLHQEENRRIVPLSKISIYFQNAVVATEDPRFYQHHGLDFSGIIRAAFKNLVHGRIVEGGSTVTQQLARNLFLTRQRKITRKLAEVVLALQIERHYSKEEILELYLNQIYLGHNAYGVESAANLYFGKHAKGLTLAESAMLAGLIRGPEYYSPYHNFTKAKQRQVYVLNKLIEHNLVSRTEAQAAATVTLEFFPANLKRLGETAPYFISHVIKELVDRYGEDEVYQGGLKVYTTLDTNMQIAAEEVVTKFASNEGGKYNFSQIALISIDPRTGYIRAMVGGVDFLESKFNRATQAKRQPGSAFKPFVYTAAMEQGFSPGTILMDTATTFDVYPNEWNPKGTWSPKNFDNKFKGPVTLRQALEKSLNIPAVKLLEQVGISSAIDVAQRMGINSHLEPGLALALGASEVSLLEITSAYGVLANSGIRLEPVAITKIENRNGVVLYQHVMAEKKALDPNVAAATIDLMQGVLQRGTGVRGRINRPAAAKTGTTQDFKDAWFIGFVPQLATGVWVGNDNNVSMEGVAEVAVCPRIWKEYNVRALQNSPVLVFPSPPWIKVKICKVSGKLPGPACPPGAQISAEFWENKAPTSLCDIHKEDAETDEFEEEPGVLNPYNYDRE